ncbi:hypothetical protein SteCoe_15695 [Stentor coeruleus]|uniref:Uncharacterized protein n=1 Tax=Stentor coeruleus TaxID=5963 RepID=A0A1R2C2W9_9CILI|nr:hypothetical protein SteCoe_15695 [Stentor coeruleus]
MESRNSDYVKVSPLLFWRPPYIYKVPEAQPGHCHVPLIQNYFSATYHPNLMSYQILAERINQTAFMSVINSGNYVIKTPYFKFLFIRWFLIIAALIVFINFITSCADGDASGIAINLIFLILCPFGMRAGGAQYLQRLQKYQKVMDKAMRSQSSTILSGSGIVVESGEKCLYLHFHEQAYSPPVQVNYLANPGYSQPDTQINL